MVSFEMAMGIGYIDALMFVDSCRSIMNVVYRYTKVHVRLNSVRLSVNMCFIGIFVGVVPCYRIQNRTTFFIVA